MPADDRRRPLGRLVLTALVCLALGAAGGVVAAAVAGSDADPPGSFALARDTPVDFRLRDQDGHLRGPRDARGDVLVLTFLYSTCRDLCPKQAADIRDAVGKAGGRGVQVLGVSVDPVGDTPARARAFLARNGLAGGPVSFLLGTRAQLAPVWRAYGIVPVGASEHEAKELAEEWDRAHGAGGEYDEYADEDAPAPAASDPYPVAGDLRFRGRRRHGVLDFEHSAYVILIDTHGRQRVGFPFEQLDVDELARDIRLLRAEP